MGKNKIIFGVMLGAAALLFGMSDAYGQQRPFPGANVNKRQHRQDTRIYNGTANGSLTKSEYHRLEKQQDHIDNMEDRFRDSGSGLNRYERARLYGAQTRASHSIYRQKHDGRRY